MPELPEVEAARRLAHKHCQGKKIVHAYISDDEKVIDGISSKDLKQALEGNTVISTSRIGKYFWLDFSEPGSQSLLLHFGMNGMLVIRTPMGQILAPEYARIDTDKSGTWPPKYCKVDMELSDGTRVAFSDSRRFARVRWVAAPRGDNGPLGRMAPDALTDMPDLDEFRATLRSRFGSRKSLKVKTLLLDQEGLISGVGNWLADEVLYQARIHPEQPVCDLSDDMIGVLHSDLKKVIGLAVEVDSDSTRFPKDWLFHYRWSGKKPVSLNGKQVHFVTVGSRTSAFVPELQKLYRPSKSEKEQAKQSKPSKCKSGLVDSLPYADLEGMDGDLREKPAKKPKVTQKVGIRGRGAFRFALMPTRLRGAPFTTATHIS